MTLVVATAGNQVFCKFAAVRGVARSRLSDRPATVPGMYRAYIGSQVPLEDAYRAAARWARTVDCVIAPSTAAIEQSPWLEQAGVPLGVSSNRHTRFTARPHGFVVAWCLNLEEILEVEHRSKPSGVVAVQTPPSLRPWVTAHNVERVAGDVLDPVEASTPATKALVSGLTRMAVINQGLIDKRERSEAIEALTYFHRHGHRLDPRQLETEAIRNGWPGQAPIELARIAESINAGKKLRFQQRLSLETLAQWTRTAK